MRHLGTVALAKLHQLCNDSVVQFLVMLDPIENPFQRVSFFLSIAHAMILTVSRP